MHHDGLQNRVLRLSKPQRGSFKSFKLKHVAPQHCKATEVRVATDCVGLNFRDVLIALNRYPEKDVSIGLEFSGRVLPNGHENSHFAVGDRIFGMALGSFASQLVVPACAVAKYPSYLSPQLAAGLPVAYTTAWHGIIEIAKLRAGQTILIHNGTGGVGMASIHLAQKIGARVIATAGSAEKRRYLNEMGVEFALDSRNEGFAKHVLNITDGRGANVVIGALPPKLSRENIDAISSGGHFVDMGKNVDLDKAKIYYLRPDIRHTSMNLGLSATEDPQWAGNILRKLCTKLSTHSLPHLPIRMYSIHEAEQAFRFLTKSQHIGKVVLRF
ncbi:MAG: zinc-binding dehydrogenase [Rhizobiales bacterium]|nr:zinc-binding dehydrogenase [Hyphomicrobiales bacterium]